MSDQIEPSENGQFIFDRLPVWMPTDEESGNFKLLDVIGQEFDRIDGAVNSLDKATTVQEAETSPQLRELANLVNVSQKSSSSVEQYRSRTIGRFQTLTSEGTPAHIIKNAATLLETDPKNIGYQKLNENGAVLVKVNSSALSQSSLGSGNFSNLLSKHSAAGFRVDASLKGTFTYITPTDYNNNNHDATKGYDGLDSNGDPKNNGGTYSGLI